MLDIIVYDWAREVGAERLLPFKHNERMRVGDDSDIFAIAREFFDRNLNVMICQPEPEPKNPFRSEQRTVIIYVDTRRFQQR